MVQSRNLRQGWQSENLARYLLSKIAFMSQPITVSDDTGSDFLCTLFEIRRIGSQDMLVPRNAFAIQIKSKNDSIPADITDKEPYIKNLEIPFFWGIVDKENAKIEIYSGEYFEIFIAHIGGVPEGKNLFLELVNERDENTPYYNKDNNYYIKFPKVFEIKVDSIDYKLSENLKPMFDICDLMIKNIAARVRQSYFFELYGGKLRIVHGPNSAIACRPNLYQGLAEVFINMPGVYIGAKDSDKPSIIEEFKLYKELFLQLSNIKKDLPITLIKSFEKANNFFLNL